jgi:hypothetical protein
LAPDVAIKGRTASGKNFSANSAVENLSSRGNIGITEVELVFVLKNKEGHPPKSRVEALDDTRIDTPYLLAPPRTVDKGSVATGREKTLSGRPRNCRRSWINSAVSRSKA